MNDVESFLKTILQKHQPIPSNLVYIMANDSKIGKRTLKKAKKNLNIRSIKKGTRWYFVDSTYIEDRKEKKDDVSKEKRNE